MMIILTLAMSLYYEMESGAQKARIGEFMIKMYAFKNTSEAQMDSLMIDSLLFSKPFSKETESDLLWDKDTVFLPKLSFTRCMRMTTQRIYNTDTSSVSWLPFLPNAFYYYLSYGRGKNWLGYQYNGIARLGFMKLRDKIVFLDGNYMRSLEYRRTVKFVVGDYEENLAEDDTIVSDIYFPRWVIMKKEKSFTLCQYFSEMRWADDWERYIDFSSHMDEYLKNGLPLDRGRMINPNDMDWDAGE